MSKHNANNAQVLTYPLGSITADMTLPQAVAHLTKKSKLVSAKLVDQAGIVADPANYISVALKIGATQIASVDSRTANQGALVAQTPKDLVITQDTIPAGSTLLLDYQETGAVGMTNAILVLEFYPL